MDRRGRTSAAYLGQLVDACVAGERDRATQLLYEHAAIVKQDAREAIERVGGEL